jgi:hypothetical protein
MVGSKKSKACRKQTLKAETGKAEIKKVKIQAPFGFVTGCHAGDKFMVQATLASMRYYFPMVPICLVVDGAFDVSDLEKDYGLIVLRISDLPSPEMRKLIAGNYRAKLAALWEGPFEFYVWLDSDAIVWGDFTSQLRFDLDFQIFGPDSERVDDSLETIPGWLPHFFFDPSLLKQFDPDFKWQGNLYFCSGAFACRRNVITFDQWTKAELWGRWKMGEQGLLNYLVHSKAGRGELKAAAANLQHIWVQHGKRELEEDCANAGWKFPAAIRRPRVAHFCGRKPFLLDRKAYSRPFTIARLEHYRRHHGRLAAWVAVLNEDRKILADKVRGRLKRIVSII